MDKLSFLKDELPTLMAKLKAGDKGNWGVLTAQGMVEHLGDALREANGKTPIKTLTPPDKLEKAKSFAMSDKPFKENTKNSMMSAEPAQLNFISIDAAIVDYQKEIKAFIKHFKGKEESTLPNPFFGDLNFAEWTHLLHKHATHHCKQFNLL